MTTYDRLQGTATDLMEKYGQGTLVYIEPGSVSGPEYDPTYGPDTEHPVEGTVRGVQQQYISEGYINASDLQVTLSVFDTTPTTSGTLKIDGRSHEIIQVDAIPGAGTKVAWRLFCRA